MPFPLSCSGDIRLAREAVPETILKQIEQALRFHDIHQIRRDSRELTFSDVALDRSNWDLFTVISSGSVVYVSDSHGPSLRFSVSLLRFFVFSTLVWPFGALVVGPGHAWLRSPETVVVVLLWIGSNVFAYFSTAIRFRNLLMQTAVEWS